MPPIAGATRKNAVPSRRRKERASKEPRGGRQRRSRRRGSAKERDRDDSDGGGVRARRKRKRRRRRKQEEVEEKRAKKPDRSWSRVQDGESCMRLATPPGGLTPRVPPALGCRHHGIQETPFHPPTSAAASSSYPQTLRIVPLPPLPLERTHARRERNPGFYPSWFFETGPSGRWQPFRKI